MCVGFCIIARSDTHKLLTLSHPIPRTNKYPREIPELPWYRTAVPQVGARGGRTCLIVVTVSGSLLIVQASRRDLD